MIEIWAIGGYSEIGKNMTALKYKDDVVILDMGVHMDKIVQLEIEEGEPMKMPAKQLIDMGALPDDEEFFAHWGKHVKGIVITHAHLDHVGGVVKLADKYNTKLIATPYTIEVLKNITTNEGLQLKTKIVPMNAGCRYKLSHNLEIEFIYMTHSIPQTVAVCVHTPEGPVLYALDWKFDEYPTLGKRTDYDRLRELGNKGILALICDSTRIEREMRTYSESYVKEMFKDILFWTENTDNAIFVTTFASHIARVNMLVSMAKEMHREPVILGRSMRNYIAAADAIGLTSIKKTTKVLSFKKQIAKSLKDIERNRKKYFVICTGGQGEPGSVMQRIANDEYRFKFQPDDQVIFSCSVIPTTTNMANRQILERNLKNKHVRIFKEVHQSGHGSREDIRDMLKMTKPKYYIPTHGGIQKLASAIELAREMNYQLGKTVHLIQNGQRLTIT
jgi:ribonuclease J